VACTKYARVDVYLWIRTATIAASMTAYRGKYVVVHGQYMWMTPAIAAG